MAWTPQVSTNVIDNGLAAMKTAATTIWICDTTMTASTGPTFTEITSTYDLGSKVLGAGAVFPNPIAAGTGGRQSATAAVVAGSVGTTGTAAYWGITDGAAMWAAGNLSSSQAVVSGNTFDLGSFTILIKNT